MVTRSFTLCFLYAVRYTLFNKMFHPTFAEFKKSAKKGNVIPVYKEMLADLETPVSAFLKIGAGPYAYLLESVESRENVGRYSFLASDPSLVFEAKGRRVTFTRFDDGYPASRTYHILGSPLDELRRLLSGYKFVAAAGLPTGQAGLPRFCGGFVGYMGYDAVRFIERLPDKNPDDLNLPDCVFLLSQNLVIFDHVDRKIKLVANAVLKDKSTRDLKGVYDSCVASIEKTMGRLSRNPILKASKKMQHKGAPRAARSNMTKKGFRRAVLKAKEHIRAGDIIQVVLSQRFSMPFKCEPFDIYRALRSVNPSPYMFYMKLGSLLLVGSSPELLVRCENGEVQTRPIAGTRPRGVTEREDEELARSLLADKKERAEHLMLVDLGRNDLGRVCAPGSVRVTDFMSIEKYSHVMHIVTNIAGRLKDGCDALDALVSCFPAGTVTGAPKVRAMEIIDELEGTRRGPYAGAIGYFSFSGNLDSCIIIRTIVIKNSRIYIQAGAGIVSDSSPGKEYDETVNKARALFEAVRRAGSK